MPAMCEEQSRLALIGTVKRNQELMITTTPRLATHAHSQYT